MTEKIALIYARVSTNKQADTGHSLDSQSRILIQQAEAEGYKVELLLENGSGGSRNRPKLNDALKRLNSGQAQALFVLDIDRLARSAIHAQEIFRQSLKRGWRLFVQSSNIDTAKPSIHTKLLLGQLAVFAEFERDLISERVKRQHQARRDRGEIWGVTQGYKGSLNPETRKRILKLHRAGKTLRAIVSDLEAAGISSPRGARWYPASVRAVINSPQSKVLVRG